MSSEPGADWLKHALLRLTPPVFCHRIWAEFACANRPISPHLIEELNEAATQMMADNDLNNACQIWLICAVLENRLDNYKTALTLIEETARLAQEHQLLQINSWVRWGASSLCARQGDWPQAIKYLQRLQQTLQQQGDWVLANVINVFETNLCQLVTTEKAAAVQSTAESQLDVILKQLLHWELPAFSQPPTAVTNQMPPSEEAAKEQKKAAPFVEPKDDTPSLTVYCLGSFRVYQDEKPIEQWFSGKGKLIFKYLLTHRQRPVAKEVLMEQFWPDTNPDAARNNLNVAIYGLRQALGNGYEAFSHILFQDDHYLLNPDLRIWVDFEAFLELWRTAQRHEKQEDCVQAIHGYNAAEALYQGEFLAEDRYEEWLLPQRQQLHDVYLNLLDRLSLYHFQNEAYAACIEACRHILAVEPCRESTHRLLMRCYCRQDQRYLGLRQYHQCVEALDNELEVAPSPETTSLYTQIRHHELV